MQVSLYNQASSSSGSSRKVKNGEEFYILSREGNWFYVAVPNDNGSYDYGYVMSYYVVENPTHIVLRNANGIYAYAAPYNTDKRVGTVSSYQRFTVIATTGNYYIVSFRNAVCYLPMDSNRYWVEEDIAYLVNGAYTQYTVSTNNAKVYGYASTATARWPPCARARWWMCSIPRMALPAIRYGKVIAFVDLNDLSQG